MAMHLKMGKFFIIFTFLLCATAAVAHAGNGASGGGRGVVCRNAQGKITSAELLDLWEARTVFGRNLIEVDRPVAEQVEQAFQRLQTVAYIPYYSEKLERTSSKKIILSVLRYMAAKFEPGAPGLVSLRGVKLNDTLDSNEPALPSECGVEQVVNFLDSPTEPRILVNQDIVDHLSPTNQAALIVHEAFYAYLRRDHGERDSIRARRAVGFVFSGGEFPELESQLEGHRYVHCTPTERGMTDFTQVYLYVNAQNTLTATSTQVRGVVTLGNYPSLPMWENNLRYVFPNGLADMFSEETCNGPSFGRRKVETVALLGQGPADFQREEYFEISCRNKKPEFSIGSYRDRQVAPQPLSCELVDETKASGTQP